MRGYDAWKTTDDSYEQVERCEQCGHPLERDYCSCSCCNEPEPEEPTETLDEIVESVHDAIANGWEGFAYMWTCDLVRAAKKVSQ